MATLILASARTVYSIAYVNARSIPQRMVTWLQVKLLRMLEKTQNIETD